VSAKATYALKAFADTLVAHDPRAKHHSQNNRRCNLLDASPLHLPQTPQVFHALHQQLLLWQDLVINGHDGATFWIIPFGELPPRNLVPYRDKAHLEEQQVPIANQLLCYALG